eukprot:8518960-Pyramimonas_sp.AAC.1
MSRDGRNEQPAQSQLVQGNAAGTSPVTRIAPHPPCPTEPKEGPKGSEKDTGATRDGSSGPPSGSQRSSSGS